MKYDVGLVGCWYWGNYGSLLNGYATNKILKSFGLNVLNIVTPFNGFESHAKKFFDIAYDLSEISESLPFERVNEYNGMCDSFVTGSDQIWNYNPREKTQEFNKYFKLNFVNEEKRKISFATSFGRYEEEPEHLHTEFERLLKRYTAISVRENESVDILSKSYGIKGIQLQEPVFNVERSVWDDLSTYSKYDEKEPYLLTYILDPTPEKRKAIEFYSQKLGMKAINILDGFSRAYKHNYEALGLPNTLPNICCFDLLKMYKDAYFVITDSFHGVCFSVIYNKPFIAISNYMRGIDRFKTLLSGIGMSDRLVSDTDIPLEEKFLYHMDFSYANKKIESERQRAVKWLEEAMYLPADKKVPLVKRHVNQYLPQERCMGCGSCVSVCPVNAIQLEADEWGVYRAIVNEDKCVDCRLCKSRCAAVSLPRNLNSSKPISYAFITSDRDELMSCASGGAGTVFSKTAIDLGGVVVGTAWKSDFSTEQIIVDKKEELDKLKKSKYFQSYTGDICKRIKKILDTGRLVLYIGTPCQIAGLKKYLNKNYNNLILVDLFCANCPSAGLFKKYLKEEHNINDIKQYNFRHKSEDDTIWNCRTSDLLTNENERVILDYDEDDYLQVFHTCSLSLASQCLVCNYQGSTRQGDLTIGDCWGIQEYDASVDPSKGVSAILVNNEKGRDFLSKIPKEYIGILKEEPLEMIKKYNVVAFYENRKWPNTLRRRVFHEEVLKNSYKEAKEKAIVIEKGKM